MKHLKNMKIIKMILLVLFFSGCVKTSNTDLIYKFDTNGSYIGFRGLPENYTAKQAEKDGCYVVENSEIVAGEQLWKDFVENTVNGRDSSIRIAIFGDKFTSYQDLFYTDGQYHIFHVNANDLEDIQAHKYKYLLILQGTLPNANNKQKVTILTDDKTLSYDDVMSQILSSNPKPISSCEIVLVDW